MIRITANTSGARAKLMRFQQGLSPEGIDPVVERVALWAIAELKKRTPTNKIGGGHLTRAAWQGPTKTQPGARLIENASKVMRFLEEGTQEHGPVRAKFLFIPLTARALGGWVKGMQFGVDYILTKHVRGIVPMRIVAGVRAEAMMRLKNEILQHVRELNK